MAHAISRVVDNGVVIDEVFTAGGLPWHKLGQNIESAVTSEEAIKLAHLDWTVDCKEIGIESQSGAFKALGGSFATVRTDNENILGIVSGKYKVVQNQDAFSFIDSLIGSGDLKYESAGALFGGKRVWLLAILPQADEVAEGDLQTRYLLFSNSHDASSSIRVLPTHVRVVCNNTLTLALRAGNDDGISIRHVGDINKKVDAARTVLSKTSEIFDAVVKQQQELAKKKLSKTEFVDYIDNLVPVPVGDLDKIKKAVSRRNNVVADISGNYYNSPTNNLSSMKQTAWAAVNSVTQYVDHTKKVRGEEEDTGDKRMDSLIFGYNSRFKQEAFELATKMFL
jgi:phage/plasmid-like protein (TIGR03299 family)